ncbi:S phase cyclin A-associated protein in the endoplasmic reticulum [Fasciola gigantica]|uniref:S phase cyclin A-associated protein in the endoplasmic reticulum n=1 Tax=Fasciola gigantica TaxID=46835 RepID=A0A504Z0M9_FASGI|nr:S phase cyclin A-associated protein in the endoplasmic reticulum [Fasciola gigantica]
MILEHSKQDFYSLIEKMNLLREYERADAENKPSSLAWDERTILPGKPIMCQVLASAAMAAVNAQGACMSIPLSVASDCSVRGTGDNDSDLGSGAGSWHLVLPKRRSRTSVTDSEHRIHGPAVTPTNKLPIGPSPVAHSNATTNTTRRSTERPLVDQGILEQQHSTNDEEIGLDDFLEVRSDLDAGESDELDADADVEEEDDGASRTTADKGFGSPDRIKNVSVGGAAIKTETPFKGIADEDEGEMEEDDGEDTTLSRDIRKLDEAIASMTNAERVLSDELDRAQYAEAALRRRFLAQDQSTRHISGVSHSNTGRVTSQITTLPIRNGAPQEEFDEIHTELDTDVDLFGVDGLLLDDDAVEEEECLAVGLDHTSSLPPTSYTAKMSVAQSQNKVPRSSVQTNYSLKQQPSSRSCRRCCVCHCHRRTHLNGALPSCSGLYRASKHARSRSLFKGDHPNNLDQQLPDSAVKKSRNGKLEDVCKAEDLTRSKPTSTPQTLSHALNNTVNIPNDLVRIATGFTLRSPTSISMVGNLSAQPPVEDEMSLSCLPKNLEESVQTLEKDVIRSPSSRLVQASHQLAAALISAPAPNGLLFVTENSAKSRVPGHGVQMHEKLSARSRRRTTNSIQELEKKQARARILRQQHLLERAERVHELSKKVEEVHIQKRLLLHQRRSCLERRLHAAERKRQAELERRVLKAHDEETKGREIAFIQTLEAEQKQHSILTKHEESQARLHELAAERRRRLEEKLCREEAAKGRRRALEASRRARLDALQARWESRAQQLASRAELLEHSRRAAARAKELNREVKIASLEEQQRTHIEQLRSKIQRKQEESERRHQEQLREISRKAFEMSILTHTADDSITAVGMEPYPIQKWCRACQVTIVSEVALKSHLQGKRHQNAVLEAGQNRPLDRSDLEAFNLLHLVDAPPELLDPLSKAEQDRLKMRRKRARKLRQRMNQRGLQFVKDLEQIKPRLPDSPNRIQLQKLVKDARRFLNLPDSGPWVITRIQAMEKTLNSLLRCLAGTRGTEKLSISDDLSPTSDELSRIALVDRQICISMGLLPILVNLIGIIRNQRPSSTQLIPDKTYLLACDVLQTVCCSCPEASDLMVLTNDVSILVDCLVARFSNPVASNRSFGTSFNSEPADTTDSCVASVPGQACTLAIMNCLTRLLNELTKKTEVATKLAGMECNSSSSMVVSQSKLQDLLGYIVSSGLVDLLASKLSSPRQASCLMRIGSPNTSTRHAGTGTASSTASVEQAQRFVLTSIDFLTSLVRLLGRISDPPTLGKPRALPSVATNAAPRGKSSVEVTDASADDFQSNPDAVTSKDSLKDNRVSSSTNRCNSTSSRETHLGSSISSSCNGAVDGRCHSADPTRLLETTANTEVFGLIPLLYGLLLDPSSRPSVGATMIESRPIGTNRLNDSSQTPVQRKRNLRTLAAKPSDGSGTKEENKTSPFRSEAIGRITLQGLKLLNSLALVNQPALQSVMGGELTCLLTRHILLSLLSRCGASTSASISHPLIGHGSPLPVSKLTSDSVDFESKTNDTARSQPGSRKQAKPVETVEPRGERNDEMSSLLPSGARQVVVRATVTVPSNRLPAEHGNKIAKFGLPSWAVDGMAPHTDSPNETNTKEQNKRSDLKTSLSDAVLHEAILCVGHLCALHPDNQSSLQRGPSPTLLQRLVALPFDYFSHRPLTDVLYPTLIACCYLHASNLAVLEAELSPTLLANYIEERLLERTMNSLTDYDGKQTSTEEVLGTRFRFECRFPVSEWNAAKAYFAH